MTGSGRVLAFLAALTVLLCGFPQRGIAGVSPDWEEEYSGENLENYRTSGDQAWGYYLLEDGTVMLTQYYAGWEKRQYHMDIPSRVDGYTVSAIGFCCFGDQDLRSVSIPDTVRYVGGAFCFTAVTDLRFPNSVTMIGSGVADDTPLKYVKLPDHLLILGDEAFRNTNVAELALPDSLEYIGSNPLAGNGIRSVKVSAGHPYLEFRDHMLITRTDRRLVLYCNQASDEVCIVPDGVEIIGSRAFSGCEKLRKVILPSSVTRIEDEAFYSCESLEEIVLPEGLSSLGNYAFHFCSALKSVSLPSTLFEVSAGCFYGCRSLTQADLGSVFAVRDSAFEGCSSLKQVSGTDEIHVIGEWAFRGCRELEEISFLQGETVQAGAFYGCTALRRIILPAPGHVEDSAFFSGISGTDYRYLPLLTCVTEKGSRLAEYCQARQIPWEERSSP